MTLAPEALAELKRRLREAEDTIRAIREGEVDALVVGGRDEEEVFAIGGDADAFRIFLEAMPHGAAALDATGRLLYANAVFATLVGQTVEAMRGRPLVALLASDIAETLAQMLDDPEAHPGGRPVVLCGPKGPRHSQISLTQLQLGTDHGFALTLTDLTERHRAEGAERSAKVAASIIGSANEAMVVCDTAGVITHANAAARAVFGRDPVGRPLGQVVPLTFAGSSQTGGTGPSDTAELLRQVMAGVPARGVEAFTATATRQTDFLISAAPLVLSEAEVSGCVVTLYDVTQRKMLERQQTLLMRELDHRVKNILAMVLSISRSTRRNSLGVEDFMEAFTGRIHALSATHNLLAEKAWTELSIAEILTAELRPHESAKEQVSLTEVDRLVTPRAAVALGILFHELTTNAVKHGALRGETGRISIAAAPGISGTLVIDWKEHLEEPLVQPVRRGFGTAVMAQSMMHSPDGGTEVRYETDGLRCTITIPAEDVL